MPGIDAGSSTPSRARGFVSGTGRRRAEKPGRRSGSERGAARPSALIRLSAQVAIVGLLVGGVAAVIGLQKTVTVSVDGQAQQVRTFGSSAGAALDAAGIEVGERDVVVPAPDESIGDGAQVSVRRARELMVTVDGATRPVWTTALSVDEALDQLGLRADDSFVSVSRSGRIPIEGLDLVIRTPRSINVLVDGKRLTRVTTAGTVAEVLAEAGITTTATDRVSPAMEAYPQDGEAVRVTRVRSKVVERKVAVPFDTRRRANGSMYKGETRTVRDGRAGQVKRTYEVTYIDGRTAGRTLVKAVRVRGPRHALVEYGTAPVPAGRVYVSTGDGPNWNALAKCESNNNPRALSASGRYMGLYQFDQQTWNGVGGTGRPHEASPAEQTKRARILYADRGRAPWPVCGKYL